MDDLVAMSAATAATLEAIKDTLSEVRRDSKEARDGVTKLTAVMGEQNVPAKLAELRSEMKAQHQELRGDLVNAIDRARTEFKDGDKALEHRVVKLDERVVLLEEDHDRREGGWIMAKLAKEWGSWLVATGAAILAWSATRVGIRH